MAQQFLISLAFLRWGSDSHSDILIIDLGDLAFLTIGLGCDNQCQSCSVGHDALRYVWGLFDGRRFGLFLFITLHGLQLEAGILILKKRHMRKTPLKAHPLQQSIDSFHKSPLYECKQQVKAEEGRLKKIGRNRLIFKENPNVLPNPLKDKENEGPRAVLRESKLGLRPNVKNLSIGHLKTINMQQRLSRMVASQKDLSHQNQSQKIKEALMKKQFFIRDRKLLPHRNCLSANLNHRPLQPQRDSHDPPQHVREFRKGLIRRRSRDVKEEEEVRQMSPFQQAQRIAEEARPITAPNASRHPLRSASLEDFLNEWKNQSRT